MNRNQSDYRLVEPENEEVSQQIVNTVEDRKGEAESEGTGFYNGALIRVQDHRIENKQLHLDIQNTNYFSHVGTRERPELDKKDRADPLSVGAYLKSSDNYIVLGERSNNVEIGEGEYQLIGAGFIEDPELQYERSLNAKSSSPIHRELEEEINLNPEQTNSTTPSALIGAVFRQPMLVYETETILDSEEITEEWLEINDDEREFSELIFVAEDKIERILEGNPEVKISDENGTKNEKYRGKLRPHAEGAINSLK
jgi:hypothetical protein